MNLNQVTVPSTDVRRSIDFYRSLGLVLIVENLPSYARFECPEGDATFSVHQINQPPGSPGAVVYFECEDLDATVARLKEGGLRFESQFKISPGSGEKHSWMTRLPRDLRRLIELGEPGSERKCFEWKRFPDRVHGIREALLFQL